MKLLCLFLTISMALIPASRLRASVAIGDHPQLQFTDAVSQQAVDLKSLTGKIVVVDFWASWCGPCMHEAAHMVELNQKYAPLGVQMIGISLDSARSAMDGAIKAKGFTWPQSFEGQAWGNKIAAAWGVRSIPHTFILSPEGEVLWEGHPAEIDPELEKAMTDHPPQLVDPLVAQQANSILDKVEAATTAEKFADAIKLLGQFPAAAKADGKIAAREDQDAKQLDTAADNILTDADSLVAQQKYSLAVAELKSLAAAMAGCDAGKKAQASLNKLRSNPAAAAALASSAREDAAKTALATAQRLQAAKRDQSAYTSFKAILKQYSGTAAAVTAADAVKTYESDPAFAKSLASEDAADRAMKARSTLSMAMNYLHAGRTDTAKSKFQEVIDHYPGTAEADSAKVELSKLTS